MEKSFEPGSVLKEGDYKKAKPMEVWQMVIIVLCVLAILFFAIRLAM